MVIHHCYATLDDVTLEDIFGLLLIIFILVNKQGIVK